MILKMSTDQNTSDVVEKVDGENAKKTKILTLLVPQELQTGGKEKKEKYKPPTKVVMRRLPPKLTKETFIEEFGPLPDYDYFKFVRADLSLRSNAFARVYINFVDQANVFVFKEKYDDYVLKDEKGKDYHAVVEFAPFQKVPKKKKIQSSGSIESDPKYIEFLQKLEEVKNAPSTNWIYLQELDALTSKAKITTTPLLEFLKQKRQKRIDLRNELKQKRREAEKERRRKEDERRKLDRERRLKEEKVEKKKSDEKIKDKEDDKKKGKEKLKKKLEKTDSAENVIVNDPAVLKVVVGQTELVKGAASLTDAKSAKSYEVGDAHIKGFKKDSRGKALEVKKSLQKREAGEPKVVKGVVRKGAPDEKGDSCSVAVQREPEPSRRPEGGAKTETKSKYRYSEQRNRDRECRNQKASEGKKAQTKPLDEKQPEIVKEVVATVRRKSLDLERQVSGEFARKRSKSFHDESNDGGELARGQSKTLVDDTDDSGNGDDLFRKRSSKKDPRADRRIRNKDRPSIEIYRPGMGRFSKQRLETKQEPNVTPPPSKPSPRPFKTQKTKSPETPDKPSETKPAKEVRTRTFCRTLSKEL